MSELDKTTLSRVDGKKMRVQIVTGRVLLLLSDLPLPGCSLGLDALVPSRFGVCLNVGNFGEFLKGQY